MGHPAVGDWLPVDFSRAVAALAKGADVVAEATQRGYSGVPTSALSAQVSPF